MLPPPPTELLHILLKDMISPGDLVIDATAGNGYDTVFLANAVGPDGRVIAVDIQEEAVLATAIRLKNQDLLGRVEIHQISHTALRELASPGAVSTVVFNLGYLPGADHTIITESENTLEALSAATVLLKLGGILAVICYPGHDGGDTEAKSVENFIGNPRIFTAARYGLISTKAVAPFLLLASKTQRT